MLCLCLHMMSKYEKSAVLCNNSGIAQELRHCHTIETKFNALWFVIFNYFYSDVTWDHVI